MLDKRAPFLSLAAIVEHGSGFDAAGTRSVSDVVVSSNKSKDLSQGFGFDLSNLLIIAGLKEGSADVVITSHDGEGHA